MIKSFLRGVVVGTLGVGDVDTDTEGNIEEDIDLDEVGYEEGDIIIDADELHALARHHEDDLAAMYKDWMMIPSDDRVSSDPEQYAKGWLEKNLDNVSDNTLVILISIFGGVILGNFASSEANISDAISKAIGRT